MRRIEYKNSYNHEVHVANIKNLYITYNGWKYSMATKAARKMVPATGGVKNRVVTAQVQRHCVKSVSIKNQPIY